MRNLDNAYICDARFVMSRIDAQNGLVMLYLKYRKFDFSSRGRRRGAN